MQKKLAINDATAKMSSGNGVCLPERENCQPISGLITPTETKRVGGSFIMLNHRLISVGSAIGGTARYWASRLAANLLNPMKGV